MTKVIALAADNKCTFQVTTLIKSICAHNRDIIFYLLNEDIPKEWFTMIRQRLKAFGCEIRDVKFFESELRDLKAPFAHINYVTYFRYLVPEVVKEDRALYLDIDVIVRGDLSDLFTIDLEGHPIAAVTESDIVTTFNAGVLLFDLNRCRKDNVTQRLIELTREKGHEFPLADQSALNYLFPDYYRLPYHYNWQPGLAIFGYTEYDKEADPLIIHYSTCHKPWNTFSSSRFRELWWFYHQLDWAEVLSYEMVGREKVELFTYLLTYLPAVFYLDRLCRHTSSGIFDTSISRCPV